ncbi:MAG: hypothetical protein J7494_12535 [Sphingobium sp.]|nr:hypothetical protein [Sphingobium sp.]
MPEIAAQLRLRRAFRYGYFLFLLVFLALLAGLGFFVFNGDLIGLLNRLANGMPVVLVALAVGLSVPLFFACWSLIGSAMLGMRAKRPSLLDGIRD